MCPHNQCLDLGKASQDDSEPVKGQNYNFSTVTRWSMRWNATGYRRSSGRFTWTTGTGVRRSACWLGGTSYAQREAVLCKPRDKIDAMGEAFHGEGAGLGGARENRPLPPSNVHNGNGENNNVENMR
nr:unnamed protein product [Callosobruchus analis]